MKTTLNWRSYFVLVELWSSDIRLVALLFFDLCFCTICLGLLALLLSVLGGLYSVIVTFPGHLSILFFAFAQPRYFGCIIPYTILYIHICPTALSTSFGEVLDVLF